MASHGSPDSLERSSSRRSSANEISLGSHRGRCGDLRVRQRQHHGAGVRAALMDVYRAKTNGSDATAEEARRAAGGRPLPGGHLGGDGVWTVSGAEASRRLAGDDVWVWL